MITRLHQVNFKKLTTRIRAYKNRYCLTHHNKRSRYMRYVSAWWILINSALPAAPASSVASRQLHDALGLRVAATGRWERTPAPAAVWPKQSEHGLGHNKT